jgi:hypothetical protein
LPVRSGSLAANSMNISADPACSRGSASEKTLGAGKSKQEAGGLKAAIWSWLLGGSKSDVKERQPQAGGLVRFAMA